MIYSIIYYSGNASTNMEIVKDNRSKPIKNETDDYKENKVAPQNIAKHETGNPIYILLVILSIMGLMPLRRKYFFPDHSAMFQM